LLFIRFHAIITGNRIFKREISDFFVIFRKFVIVVGKMNFNIHPNHSYAEQNFNPIKFHLQKNKVFFEK
jgi:hypothetical protein